MARDPNRTERIAELRQKFGRQPLPETSNPVPATPREAQPRFRGLESGHRACQGCGEALAARLVMECAGPDVMVANAPGAWRCSPRLAAIGLASALGAFACSKTPPPSLRAWKRR